jgi:hypothetical protein
MRPYYIVSTCSPLIYLTSLSDDIVVGNISPVFVDSMVAIDSSYDLSISLITIESNSLMMEDDMRDLFDLLQGDTEWMSVLTVSTLDDCSTVSERFLDEFDTSILSVDSIELCLGLGALDIGEIGRMPRLPYRTICIPESLISSPLSSRYDIYRVR